MKAIVCARFNLERIKLLINDENLNINKYFRYTDGECDSIYMQCLFKLKNKLLQLIRIFPLMIHLIQLHSNVVCKFIFAFFIN